MSAKSIRDYAREPLKRAPFSRIPRKGVHAFLEMASETSRNLIHHILTEQSGYQKICPDFVRPKMNDNQTSLRSQACEGIYKEFKSDNIFFCNSDTGDKT